MNFSEFCGGKLWDRHLTWDTDYPQFSNCFLTTIISWVPCTFLLLSSPFYYFAYLRNLPTLPSFRPSKLHIIKFLSTILMFLLQLSNFIHHATAFSNSQPQYFPSDIFTPALCLLAFSVSLLLLEVERRKRLVTSGVHFIFFLLFFISSLLYFTTFISWELMQGSRGRDTYKLVSWTFFSFLCLLQLITFSFPDRDHYDSIPPSSFSHENRPLCPEVEASFISRMFFCWIKDIVYQGYKKTLTEKDLFDLNPRDQTNKNAAALEKAWLEEVKRCERYNRRFKEQEETEDETEALLTASSSHGTFEDTHHSTIPPISFSPDKRLKRPSLWKVIARTFGPHLFLSHVIKVFCDLLLLAGPLIQSLVIDFIEATTASSSHAWQGYFYGLLFFLNALCYTVLFQWVFHIGMNIGMRINSSLISLVYKKALTMDSEARRKTTVGEVVNLMSVDAQRIQDATAYLWMLWSSPLQIVLSLVLLWRYLGPSIFAGMAVMILMIPINAVVATYQKKLQVMEVCAMKRDLEILPGGDMTEIGEKGINLSGGQKQRVSLARALYQDCDIYLLDDPLSAVDSHVAKHIFKQAIGPEGFLKDKTRVLVTHGITWLPRCDVIVVMAQGGMVSESGSYDDLLDHNVEFAKFIREFLMQHEDEEEEEEEEDGGDEDAVAKRERRDRKVSVRSKKSISSAFSDDGNEADMDRDEEDDEDGSDDNDYLGLSPLPLSEALSSFEKKRQVKRLLLDRVTSILSDDDELPSFETRGSRERYERGLMISLKEKSKTRFKASSAPLERSILDYETPPLYAADDRKLLKKRKKKESVSKEEEEEGEVVAGTDRSRITMDEFAEAGQVKLSVYWTYVKSLGWLLSLIFIFAFLLFQVSALLSNFWLSKWTNDPAIVNYSLSNNNISSLPTSFYGVQLTYLAGYGGFGIMQACFILIYALVSAQGNVNSSHHLHKGLLDAILRAPMAFFDTTPIGRVLNRFSKDIEMVDNNLISTIKSWLNNFFSIISTVVVISYSTPIFLVVVFPVLLIYFFLQRFYTPTTRQLKRLESTSKSPIYNHFSESISGASVIRSFNKQEDFIARSQYLVDHNLSIYFANITSNRWLSIILDSMGGLITLSATVFAVMSRHSLSPSLVGLSISYALQITMSLTWLVRMSTQLESNIVSVERILEYSKTPSEADWCEGTENPPAGWPMRGSLLFRQYGLRYRPNLDLVLKNLNITVRGGEKIGIVGRTGAGKSSVTLALFRIIEAAEGGIFLDGVDISKLGLYKLRSSITILPQDPVLFSGSLRSNLDPTGRYTDEEVWTALEHANLKTFVNKLPMKLDHECGEGGENLSVGQRQLVCLGRTLLRKTKVLVLDEATAAVDLETDKVIQDTIRQEFKECTILTIAHRINTVLDNDRVMVMDAGSVVEFDSPSLLLANRSSHFHALAKDAGIIS